MTETKFTPGPWRLNDEWPIRIVADQGPLQVSPATANSIADAHLIAAAPDLYAACEDCASLFIIGDHDGPISFDELVREFARRQGVAIAALQRALGERP